MTVSAFTGYFFFGFLPTAIAHIIVAFCNPDYWPTLSGLFETFVAVPAVCALGAAAGAVLIHTFGFVPPLRKKQARHVGKAFASLFLLLAALTPLEIGRYGLMVNWVGTLISFGASLVCLAISYFFTGSDPDLQVFGNGVYFHRHLLWMYIVLYVLCILNDVVYPTSLYLSPILGCAGIVLIIRGLDFFGLIYQQSQFEPSQSPQRLQ